MRGGMPFELWNSDLAAICGSYFGVPKTRQHNVVGQIAVRAFDRLDVADISDDIDRIVRDRRGIRQDDAEHVFLVMQIAGRLGVAHNGHRATLVPGDCILLDSTKEGTLQNLGDHRRILSFHLPRQSFLSERGAMPQIGKPMERSALQARLLRRHLLRERPRGSTAACSDLLYDLVHHTFARPGDDLAGIATETEASRRALASDVMDLNLSNEALSLPWLAKRIGLSTRQLQRLFQAQGTSFRDLLRAKRYRFVVEHLDRLPRAHGRIATLAFQAGFRDLSNFNRGFRRRFGMTPRDYHASALARMAQKSEISTGDER